MRSVYHCTVQWFGNLVTMRWWNDLWLNEGFASWMEYRGVAHTQPDWQMLVALNILMHSTGTVVRCIVQDQFWAAKLMPALRLDSLASSHPVSTAVADPKEIEAIFDTISYRKGSSIIHMLVMVWIIYSEIFRCQSLKVVLKVIILQEQYLGSEDLRTGLRDYLSSHKFGSAVTADLWAALGRASSAGVAVAEMMNTWTLQQV